MEILVTSSIIPYLKILYPHMGPPTTPGPAGPHHLNPALTTIAEIWSALLMLCGLLKSAVCIPCPINSDFELEGSLLQ